MSDGRVFSLNFTDSKRQLGLLFFFSSVQKYVRESNDGECLGTGLNGILTERAQTISQRTGLRRDTQKPCFEMDIESWNQEYLLRSTFTYLS